MRHNDIVNNIWPKSLIAGKRVDAIFGIMGITKSINQISNKGIIYSEDLTDLFNDISHAISAVCEDMLATDDFGKLVKSVGEVKRFLSVTIDTLKEITIKKSTQAEVNLYSNIIKVEQNFLGAEEDREILKNQIVALQEALKLYVAEQGLELAKKYAIKKGEEVKNNLRAVSTVASAQAQQITKIFQNIADVQAKNHELNIFIKGIEAQGADIHTLASDVVNDFNKQLTEIITSFNVEVGKIKELYNHYLQVIQTYINDKQKEQDKLDNASELLNQKDKELKEQISNLSQEILVLEQKLISIKQQLATADSKGLEKEVAIFTSSLIEANKALANKQDEIAAMLATADKYKKDQYKNKELILNTNDQLETTSSHLSKLRIGILPENISYDLVIIHDKMLNIEALSEITDRAYRLQQFVDLIIEHGVAAQFASDIIEEQQQLYDSIFINSNLFTGMYQESGKTIKEYKEVVIEPFLARVTLDQADKSYIKKHLKYETEQVHLRGAMLEVASGRIEEEVKKKLAEVKLSPEQVTKVVQKVNLRIQSILEKLVLTQENQLRDAKEKLQQYVENLIVSIDVKEVEKLKKEVHSAISALDPDGIKKLKLWVDTQQDSLKSKINYILSFEGKDFSVHDIKTNQQAMEFIGDLELYYKARLNYIHKRALDLSNPINVVAIRATQDLDPKDMQELMIKLSNDLSHKIKEMTQEILLGINIAQANYCTGIPSFF